MIETFMFKFYKSFKKSRAFTKRSILSCKYVFILLNFCPRSIRNNMALLQKELSSGFVKKIIIKV